MQSNANTKSKNGVSLWGLNTMPFRTEARGNVTTGLQGDSMTVHKDI